MHKYLPKNTAEKKIREEAAEKLRVEGKLKHAAEQAEEVGRRCWKYNVAFHYPNGTIKVGSIIKKGNSTISLIDSLLFCTVDWIYHHA